MASTTVTAWILFLIAGVIATPFVIEAKRRKMDAEARKNAPGQFAKLPQGVTHFQWFGPDSGPVVVCIHGLTTPSFVWRSTAAELARQGFRVLTYDHFGRGYSDRPPGRQDQTFFIRHLNDLLEAQDVSDELTIIGYSMGGAVAAAFAADQPDRVRDVVLLAPAGMKTVGTGTLRAMVALPVIGAWLMLALYPSMLRRGIRAEIDLPTTVEGITDMQMAELDWRGFVPSVHASLKGLLSRNLKAEHRKLYALKLPVLAIWARDDDVIPLAASDLLMEWNGDVETLVVDNAGHGVTYTHTDEILPVISAFLKKHF